jgi:hypothetical protein
MNLKAGHEFEQRHLEAEFGQSKFFEPCPWGVKWMYNFFSTQLFKKNRFRVRIEKLLPFYRTTSELGFQRCAAGSDWKSGEAMKMKTSRR